MREARWLCTLAAAMAVAGCAITAEYRQADFREEPMGVASLVLPNGLQVLAERDTGSAMVGMALVVSAGSTDDPPGREGLAHLVEHLAFRGKLPRGTTVGEALEYAGAADHNALTGRDLTTYLALSPRETLPALVAVAAALLEGAPVEPQVFEVERAVVEAEQDRGSDRSSREVAQWWMREALYPPGHPSSRPSLGTRTSVRAITPAEVAAFRAALYRPERATLVFTGGVSLPVLQTLLRTAFPAPDRTVSRPPPPRLAPEEPPPPPGARLLHRTAPVAEDELYLGWSLPSRFAQPEVLRHLEATLDWALGGISYTQKEVKEVSVHLEHGLHDASLVAHLVLRPGSDPQAVMAEVTARLDRKLEGWRPGSSKRERRKATFHPSLMSAMDRAATRGELAQGEQELRLNSGEVYSQADADWAPALAWLKSERARGVHVSPGGLLGAPATEGRQVVLPGRRGQEVRFPPEVVQQLGQAMGAGTTQVEELGNGLQVAVLSTRRFANTAVAVLLPGGPAQAPSLEASLLALGLGHTNVTGLYDPLSAGAVGGRRVFPDGLAYLLVGKPSSLDAMLGWAHYRLAGRWKVEWGLLPYLRLVGKDELKRLDTRPQVRAQRAFLEALWRGHPYGGAQVDTWEAVASLGESDLETWLQRSHAPDRAVVVVVGNVEPARALATARAELGALPRGPHFAPPPPGPTRAGRPRALLTAIPEMSQVGVTWGCLASIGGPRQAAVARLAASWLNLQLLDRLRERSGAAYAAEVSTERWWGGAGALLASVEVSPAQLPHLLDALEELLSGASLQPGALLNAAWDELRSRNGRYELPGPLALDLATQLRDGWPVEALDQTPRSLVTITPEEVRAVLTGCREAEVYSLVGDPEVVRRAVQASTLGRSVSLEETPGKR